MVKDHSDSREREETRCRNMDYSFRLATRVLLYAPSHRQDSTYHSLCYTSRVWYICMHRDMYFFLLRICSAALSISLTRLKQGTMQPFRGRVGGGGVEGPMDMVLSLRFEYILTPQRYKTIRTVYSLREDSQLHPFYFHKLSRTILLL